MFRCKGLHEEKLRLVHGRVLDVMPQLGEVADKTARRLYNRKARRNRKASARIATYRLAVLLGGINVAYQWRKPDTGTRRDKSGCFCGAFDPELQTSSSTALAAARQSANDSDVRGRGARTTTLPLRSTGR